MNSENPNAGYTIRHQRLDFTDWHRGRPRYLLWALHWDSSGLSDRMRSAQAHLADFLLDDYRRQAHITLSLCGFPSRAPSRPDEFGPAQFDAQLAALRRAAPQPFDIQIGALESFASVPYFEVHAPPGVLLALRACLRCGEADAHGTGYTPHVTLGLYADAWPFARVRQRMAQWQDPQQHLQEQQAGTRYGTARVTGLELLSYAAADIGGPLQLLGCYDFDGACMEWDGDALFGA